MDAAGREARKPPDDRISESRAIRPDLSGQAGTVRPGRFYSGERKRPVREKRKPRKDAVNQVLIVRGLWFLGGAVVALGGVAGCVAWAMRPARAAAAMTRPRRKPDAAEKIEARARELEARGFEVVSLEIPSAHARPEEGEVILRGWFVRAPNSGAASDRCVILVHGLGPSRLSLDDWMDLVLGAGWNVASFDLRAHGVSDGDYCTFGFLEARELADQVRHIRERYGQTRIVLLGFSMGGAVSALSLDHLAPGDVDGVVTVGTYDDFPGQADTYLASHMRGFSTARWRRRVVEEGERIFGAPASTLSPAAVPPRLESAPPALILHGRNDTMIPFHRSAGLAGAFNGRARLHPVDGADHMDILEKGGAPLRAEIVRFLNAVATTASVSGPRAASPRVSPTSPPTVHP